MSEPVLDHEAYRLLTSISGRMELWILAQARARAEARAAVLDSPVHIVPSDIQEAAQLFLDSGTQEFKSALVL